MVSGFSTFEFDVKVCSGVKLVLMGVEMMSTPYLEIRISEFLQLDYFQTSIWCDSDFFSSMTAFFLALQFYIFYIISQYANCLFYILMLLIRSGNMRFSLSNYVDSAWRPPLRRSQ